MLLTKLTPEQEALLPIYRDKWLSIGLSTARGDRRKAKRAINKLYRQANLTPPKQIIWVDSPLGALYAYLVLKTISQGADILVNDQVRDRTSDQISGQVWDRVFDQVNGKVSLQVWNQVWDQVRDRVKGQINEQVKVQIKDQIRDQILDQTSGEVRDQVRDQVWRQISDQVSSQVWNPIMNQVWEQVKDQVRDQVRDQVGGQIKSQVSDQIQGQIRGQVFDQVGSQTWDQVNNQIWAQVSALVSSQVWNQVMHKAFDQIWDQVSSQIWSQVWNQVSGEDEGQVGGQVRGQIRDQIESSVSDQVFHQTSGEVSNQAWDQARHQALDTVKDQTRNFCYGSHEASWLGFYEYFQDVCNLPLDRLPPLITIAENCGWWLPYKQFAIVSAKPTEIHIQNGVLHNSRGAAIRYADGFSVWALNGVRVSREIVETSEEKLDAHLILTETNAEVRREIVRKIGVERMCNDLNAKPIDTVGDYTLLLLDLGDGRQRPYLKMLNPSIGIYHIEGIHPDCDTVEKALNWRNKTDEKPFIIT